MRPLVSVVIPCHNQAKFLRTAIDSVRNQTYPDVEIILVNDGSTDDTPLVAKEYGDAIKYCDQENRGLSAARNAGITRAEGRYLNFLDADDYLLPEAIEQFMKAADRHPEDAVFYGGWHQVDADNGLIARRGPRVLRDDFYHDLLTEDPFPCHTLLIPRSILLNVGIFDPELRSSEDWDLWLRIASKGYPFIPVPEAVVAYRRYPGSMSRDGNRMFDARISVQRKYRLGHGRCPSCLDATIRMDAGLGREEVRLCREQPRYRRHSGISGINGNSLIDGVLRRLVVRTTFPPGSATRTLYASVLRGELKGAWRVLGRILFGIGYGITRYRSALQEIGSWEGFHREFGMQLPVLVYHNVSPAPVEKCRELTVTPKSFKRQMEWLSRNGYQGIRASDWLAWIEEAQPLPPKPVLITFDDGYADIAHHALPVLRDLGHRCTIFPITAKLGQRTPWDGQALLTQDQITEWSARGVEFGSHSHTHRDLVDTDPVQIARELTSSVETLEQLAGHRPVSFAYPYGKHAPGLLSQLRGIFGLAFTLEPGLNDLRTDPLRLRRTFVGPRDSLVEFSLRVRFGRNPLDWLRARIGLRSRLRGLATGRPAHSSSS